MHVFRVDLNLFENSPTVRGEDEVFLLGLPNKHCVAIVGGVLLDPDSSFGVSVTQENMDHSCGMSAPYSRPAWAWVVTPRLREDRRKRRRSKKKACMIQEADTRKKRKVTK